MRYFRYNIVPIFFLNALLLLALLHYFMYETILVYAGIILSVAWVAIQIFDVYKAENHYYASGNILWGQKGLYEVLQFVAGIALLVYWIIMAIKPSDHDEANRKFGSMDAYFEKIRNNEAALTAFFSQMPKGGDLHNHYSGAVYAEWYIQDAIDRKLFINPNTLAFTTKAPQKAGKDTLRIDTFTSNKGFANLRQRLIQEWSSKDYYDGFRPSDKHFFDAFGKFPPGDDWAITRKGLLELKERAKAENVQYLEIMPRSIPHPIDTSKYHTEDMALRAAAEKTDKRDLNAIFSNLYKEFNAPAAVAGLKFIDSLRKMHPGIDDDDFTMRYLAFVKRESRPVIVFKDLLTAFHAAAQDSLIVGLNIVNREDGVLSMKDYALHMQMFKFLHSAFPAVKYSLHAGELTIGFVKPEDLTWHIRDAIYTAGADRIGHGVDLPYEKDNQQLLKYMSLHKKAVEINLVSNEFILKVKDNSHPLMLYVNHKVPVVISTDDAGILRTNMTAQFVVLAYRYKEIRYSDIKQFVLNSIEYSFIKDSLLKENILKSLKNELSAFEKTALDQ